MEKPNKYDFGFKDNIRTEQWHELGGKESYRIACEEYEDLSKRIVKRKRSYTFTIEEYTDGCQAMIRHNDGFSALELIGICSMITREVTDELEGRIKPDIIKRNYVED